MTNSEENGARLIWTQWGVLAAGFVIGVIAAAIVVSLPLDFSSQLAEAKRLGVVSRTILAGYPKSRDVMVYAAVLLLPVACSFGAWLAWSNGQRASLAGLFSEDPNAPVKISPRRLLVALALLIGVLLLQFNINNFHEPAGGWGFLGEEGQFLADAQILLGGGEYARDFLCLYGPLAVYPVGWAMKVFGATMMVARFYTYGLTVVSAVILVAAVTATVKNRILFIAAALLLGVLFVGGGGRTSATMLRVILGIVPLLILYRGTTSDSRLPSLAAGVSLGVSLLFSQEVGICALLASGVFVVFEAYRARSFRQLALQGGLLLAGASLVVLPMLAYFQHQGALSRFFDSLYGYPKVVTLGYGALPFPSLRAFIGAPLASGAYFPYWIIGVYASASVALLVLLFLRRGGLEVNFRSALLVFGILLFRAALGRSDESHYFFALLPALLLVVLFIDDALQGLSASPHAVLDMGRRALIGGLVLSLLVLLGSSRVLRSNVAGAFSELGRFPTKFSVQKAGVALPWLTRSGTFFDEATAADLTKIRGALAKHAKPGDPVLFFPNEAAYYFLFDRRVPTRFVHAYFAVSIQHRKEMVAELEKSRPPLVVYTLDSWRIDDIPEDLQVPEVVQYLREKYELAEDLGNILILRRKTP